MKTLSTAWKNYLASGGTSLAMCIKVTLQDGTVYGFTTASREFTYLGVVYYPQQGVTPSVITSGEDMAPGNMEAVGFFDADGVLMSDIRAGKFNSATHETFIVNYDDLSMGHIDRLAGPIGQFKSKGNRFTFELKDWLDNLTLKSGVATTPYCRVKRLGDSVCGVKMGSTFETTGLATSYVDAVGQFDLPFDADMVAVNIMNDGRLSVVMLNTSQTSREFSIRDPDTLAVQEILPDLGVTQSNFLTGLLVNQYGDMFNGRTYRKKNVANVSIGADFHTRGAMALDGRFFVACRWKTSAPQTSALFVINTDGSIQQFDFAGTALPLDLFYAHDGYAYVSFDNGSGGVLVKVDVSTGAIVKTSTLVDSFGRIAVTPDESVFYRGSLGRQVRRMPPTWDSAAVLFDYGVASTSNAYEECARNWGTSGVVSGHHAEFKHYDQDGSEIESIAFPLAITAYKIATHPSFPNLIIYSDNRAISGKGQVRFVAKVLRPVTGSSTSWQPMTAVTAKVTGDAKLGSAVRPAVFNGLYYVCSQSGITGGTEPTWLTTPGVEFSDGSAKWIGRVANRWPRTVSAVTDRHTFTVSGAGTPAIDLYKYGIVTWLTGANAGIEMEIMSNTETTVTTYLEAPYDIQVGDTCEIERGCDRSKEMCKGDFGNIWNFDGEPQKPAADFLLAYTTR